MISPVYPELCLSSGQPGQMCACVCVCVGPGVCASMLILFPLDLQGLGPPDLAYRSHTGQQAGLDLDHKHTHTLKISHTHKDTNARVCVCVLTCV